MHPEDRERVAANRAAAFAHAGMHEDEYRILLPSGDVRWIATNKETIADGSGQPIRVISTTLDITRRKEQENNVRFLLREVSHRSKNLLAIIQALANQTGRSSQSYSEFQKRFSQRLQGMAALHELLVNQNWRGVDVAELVRAQLRPFVDEASDRVTITGPRLLLSPAAAQSIGMAIHELATNATKHGSLSVPTGTVSINWELRRKQDDILPSLKMVWKEQGGPPVVPPERSGFGFVVFERMAKQALNAEITLEFPPEGLIWTMEAGFASLTKVELRLDGRHARRSPMNGGKCVGVTEQSSGLAVSPALTIKGAMPWTIRISTDCSCTPSRTSITPSMRS